VGGGRSRGSGDRHYFRLSDVKTECAVGDVSREGILAKRQHAGCLNDSDEQGTERAGGRKQTDGIRFEETTRGEKRKEEAMVTHACSSLTLLSEGGGGGKEKKKK